MDTYDELIDRIYSVPEGPEQIAYMEELVRLADSNNDISTAYRARREIARVANEEGFPEKAIVAFSWCLAKFDEDEELDHWHSLLWQYKVILEMIPVFHTVSREQIVNMQEFTQGFPGSPDCNGVSILLNGLMEALEQGRDNVAVLGVVIISRAVEISGHDAAVISTILPVI